MASRQVPQLAPVLTWKSRTMSADRTRPPDPAGAITQARSSRMLVALAVGLSIAAVAVAWYSYAHRVPDTGRSAVTMHPASQLMGGSLALVALGAAAVITLGTLALTGRRMVANSALLLFVVAGTTAYAYLGPAAERLTVRLSGPGAHPTVVALTQLGWPILTASAVALLIGALTASKSRSPARVRFSTPSRLAVGGLVVGLVVGPAAAVGLVASTGRPIAGTTTAAPADIPALPTSVGTAIAYTLPVLDPDRVIPAGAGYAVRAKDAIVGYDGSTGAMRWRFPFTGLPADCTTNGFRTTGTAPSSIVIASCVRSTVRPFAKDRHDTDEQRSFLVGLDAMTGRMLWANDDDWTLAGRAELPVGVVPVARRDAVGSLDPQTGRTRWTKPLFGTLCSDTITALDRAIAYLPRCAGTAELHVVDAATGTERTAELQLPPDLDPKQCAFVGAGTDGTLIVFQLDTDDAEPHQFIVSDPSTGELVATWPKSSSSSADYSVRSGQLPGPLQQAANDQRAGSADVFAMAQRTMVHVAGLQVHGITVLGGQQWAVVGERMVTAAAAALDDSHSATLASVAADGVVTRGPSPCGRDFGGVVAVPGATLLICTRGELAAGRTYEVIGLR
jgi:outer membrane protein assembly factor BamB